MLSRLVIEHPFWGIFGLAVATVCLLTLLGFLGRLWWFFDLTSHFRGQYFFILILSSLIFLLGKQPAAAGGAVFFALINLAFVVPLYIHSDPAIDAVRNRRILLLNVLQRNNHYEEVRSLIRSEQPDILVLVETNQKWLDELGKFQSVYPYSHSKPRDDNYGVSLFSREPLQEAEIRYFGDAGVPTVVAHLQSDEYSLTVIGTHPPPPKGALNSAFRNQQLDALADFAREQSGEVILCGDLNMSPWSPYFWRLLQKSGLQNSARGFGLQPTWPTDRPLLRVPIDHCLVSSGITISDRRIGPFVGSDHFPVILDFSFNQHAQLKDLLG
jgi:endonuclease/exonuclease/phosphatase (EEP) superfamily protein YafD